MQFVFSFALVAVYVSLFGDGGFALTWSLDSGVVQVLLALLVGVLAILRLKPGKIRWQTCALAGLLFGSAIALLFAGDVSALPLASVLLLSDVAISWSFGFVCFWYIVLRSNRPIDSGQLERVLNVDCGLSLTQER